MKFRVCLTEFQLLDIFWSFFLTNQSIVFLNPDQSQELKLPTESALFVWTSQSNHKYYEQGRFMWTFNQRLLETKMIFGDSYIIST